MSYPVGKRTKARQAQGIYIYAGKGKVNGVQPICFYFTYKKSGYIKVGWNHEGFTIEDAKAKRSEYIRALRYGEEAPDPKRYALTFGEGYKRFLAHCAETNLSTVIGDTYIYQKHYARAFAKKPLNTISRTDIQRFLGGLTRAGLSPLYRQKILSSLRRGFSYLIGEGLCKTDPTVGIKIKASRLIKDRYLEMHEINAMLEYCDVRSTHGRYARDWLETKAQVLLGVEMGFRRSEMATQPHYVTDYGVDYSLLWERINWETGTIRIVGKGGKERVLPMTPRVKAALMALGVQKRGKVFAVQQCIRIKSMFVALGFNQGLDPTNVDDRRNWVSMHTLRHTFGTYATLATRDLHMVAQLMGHSDVKTTSIYSHLIKGEVESAMDNIGDLFTRNAGPRKVIPMKRPA